MVAGDEAACLAANAANTWAETWTKHLADAGAHGGSASQALYAGSGILGFVHGDDFVAACTSRDLIRIYSTGGVEDAVVASLGPVVACAAHGKYLAIA